MNWVRDVQIHRGIAWNVALWRCLKTVRCGAYTEKYTERMEKNDDMMCVCVSVISFGISLILCDVFVTARSHFGYFASRNTAIKREHKSFIYQFKIGEWKKRALNWQLKCSFIYTIGRSKFRFIYLFIHSDSYSNRFRFMQNQRFTLFYSLAKSFDKNVRNEISCSICNECQ